MDNLIRTDTVFGKRVNMVGNISADLVLESLGKIYIKSRNKSLTLEELITSLVLEDPNASTSRVKIVEGIEGLDTSEFKEGTFVFDKLSNILYLFIDGELLELINVAPEGTGYVKRSGDTMTGRLAIYVKDGPPLYVNSAVLVPNLNAQYLNGETAETFTRRHRDEKISGSWTFKASTYFKSNIKAEKDIVINGSIGSPNFASGFGGYGWRMDADTNTLTVDNLVVRKLMKVYELVVNKISATNGSLWVSNAGKVVSVVKLDVKPYEFFSASHADYSRYVAGLRMGDVLIKMPENPTLEDLDEEAFSTPSGDNIVTRNCYSSTTLAGMLFIDVTADKPNLAANQGARFNPVFETGFRFDCTFPIITRNDKATYDENYENIITTEEELKNLRLTHALSSEIEAKEQELEEYYEAANPRDYVSLIRSYYKYFAGGDFYYVRFDDDNLPVFKAGDLLRCLKWTNGGVKYYDALVCNYVGKGFILLLAPNFLDKKTTITYDDGLNPEYTVEEDSRNLDLYKTTRNYKEPEEINRVYNDDDTTTTFTYDEALDMSLMGMVEVNDSLVLMGHLWDKLRQNAVYITSTDDAAPYMDVLSGINRPDYSVNYHIPVYQTVKLHQVSYSLTVFVGYNNLVEIPYTGDYYIQDTSISNYTCEYVCFRFNNVVYLAKGKNAPNQAGVYVLYHLNIIPDKCTLLGESSLNFYINLEEDDNDNEQHILLEDGSGNLILEKQFRKLTLSSTRTVKARLGNLDGISDETFPTDRQPYGYGLYGQNVFLTGEFYLNNGQAVADLGKDAMAFAIAASRSGNAAINLLRTDMARADNLLKASHYNKGTLKTAGMYIGNDSDGYPGIVIWGNKILFATTDLEFDGKVAPTLLLQDGKIQGKYLGVDEAHGTVDAIVLASEFTIKGENNTTTKYTSLDLSPGTVRVFRPKMLNTASDGTIYYTDSDQVYYVRRFMVNNDGTLIRWLIVNPDGYPQLKNAFGEYTSVTYPNFTYFNSDNEPVTYADGNLPTEVETAFLNDYTTPLKVWSLEKNGKGNLGGSTLYWNSTGKVVVNGILYSTEGNIGGLNLGDGSLFTLAKDVNDMAFNPILISTRGYGYYNNETTFPYIQLNSLDSIGTIRDRTVLTSRGLFYLGNANASSTVARWSDYISAQVPAVLFTLTVIPIYLAGKNSWTLQARLSCGMTVFRYIHARYDEGVYVLNFPLMENSGSTAATWGNERDWFLEKLAKGQVHFLVSGYTAGYTSDTSLSALDFNVESMYAHPSYGYRQEGENIKANIAHMTFSGTNHSLNVGRDTTDYATTYYYAVEIFRTEDKSLWGSPDEGGLCYWGPGKTPFAANSFNNYIKIETSDDDSGNWGGFNLTALYIPTFDDRFIEDGQTKTIDWSLEDLDAAVLADTLRASLIASYGTGGTYPTTLTTNLDNKVSGMTSEQLTSQATDISNIRTAISDMISYANNISIGADLGSLQYYQTVLEGRYDSISDDIDDLESGSSSSTVTPPSTSPDSDNTDNKYTVTGSGYHNNTSDAVSADGTSSIAVGKITSIDSSLSGVTPTVWAVYDIEGSNIINKSNVTLDPDNSEYIIKAVVNANPTSSTRKARIFVTFDGGNHYGYVNVYQAAGSGTQCDSCSVRHSRFIPSLITYANGGQGYGIADAAGYSTARVIGELKGCTSAPNVTFTITAGSENVGNISTFASAWSNVTISLVTPNLVLAQLQSGQNEYDAHGDSNYLVVASNIPANNSGGFIHAHFTPNCDTDHITFKLNYSSGSSTPTEDSTLDTFINNITGGGTNSKISTVLTNVISASNTPNTYSYLLSGYNYVSDKSDATKSWMLANMLAELTPYVYYTSINDGYYLTIQNSTDSRDIATNYFVNAAKCYGGLKLDYLSNELTYLDRINGAVEYAKFKHSNYSNLKVAAESARTELRSKGITLALMRGDSEPNNEHNYHFFTKNDCVHVLPIVPNDMPTNSPSGGDWLFTLSMITLYPTPASMSSINYLPLMDKETSEAYYCNILGLESKYASYLYACNDIGDASGNQIKSSYARPRPGTLNNLNIKSGSTTFNVPPGGSVYLCDCSIEFSDLSANDYAWSTSYDCSATKYNDVLGINETYCQHDIRAFTDDTANNTVAGANNSYRSYSSGHSSRAFTNLLLAIEAAGDSMNKDGYTSRATRIHQYCLNRAIMRAHWKTDTIAGRLAASMLIGFLNGCNELHQEIAKL